MDICANNALFQRPKRSGLGHATSSFLVSRIWIEKESTSTRVLLFYACMYMCEWFCGGEDNEMQDIDGKRSSTPSMVEGLIVRSHRS